MITALPDSPLPTDARSIFNAKAFALFAALPTMVEEFNAAATAYALSLASTSTSSVTIGLGTKTFTVQTGKGYLPGQEVLSADSVTPTNRVAGTVLSYDSGTGVLEMTATSFGGSGTHASWTITPTAVAGFDGQTFTNLVLAGKITEEPVAMPADALDPSLGTFQTRTLSGTTTFTDSLATGESMVLHLTRGSNALTWPTMDWLYGDPTIPTGKCVAILWKEGSTLCGCYAGPLQ